MSDEAKPDLDGLKARIAELRQEHQDLDAAVAALESAANFQDQIQVARLKKRKLALRDQIVLLDNQLTPDIIA